MRDTLKDITTGAADPKKFKSVNDLKLQIEQDKILSLNVLNSKKKHNNFSEK